MIKFMCINKQHADIAMKQLEANSIIATVIGRCVFAAGDWDSFTKSVMEEAMGVKVDLTIDDIQELKRRNDNC
jgi:hypothetical protein